MRLEGERRMRLIDLDAEKPYLLDGVYFVGTLTRCKDCKYDKTEECSMVFYNGGDKNRPMWWSKDDGLCHFGERKDHEQRTDI